MKKITIECKHIKKSFGNGQEQIEILHGIDFVAYENELIMLMGPSGSGKTTLISIIGGILSPSSGECFILNKNIHTLPEHEKTAFRGKNIGFIFQHFCLIPTLNALENTVIPLLCLGASRDESFPKAAKILESMDLTKQHQLKNPSKLSGGEQQRVALARAFIHEPKVLLCDEPTSFLDLERGKKIMQILRTFKETKQCTIIVVTHDPRILSFADRIIHIEDGLIKEKKIEESLDQLPETK